MRSFMDITFFWIEENQENWELKHGMFACKFFSDKKTAQNIESELENVLLEAGISLENTPVTTDKGRNIVAATQQHIRNDCSCHRLCTCINDAWKKTMEDMNELKELDDLVNNIVRFVKKSANIQHRLPSTLKSGGKTRPWRSLNRQISKCD